MIQIDFDRRCVRVNGLDVRLTPVEYRLVATLARRAGRIVPVADLVHQAWGEASCPPGYLEIYVERLWHKLERDPKRPRLLFPDGTGYRLELDELREAG
jgi:two-component system KDP operon response regulator KdpE